MRLPRLSLKARIFIALLAIALVRSAFYFIPRYAATRPRFDPSAYNEALEILKEVVGPAAVDKGIYYIPRKAVRVPYRGMVQLTCTSVDNYIPQDRSFALSMFWLDLTRPVSSALWIRYSKDVSSGSQAHACDVARIDSATARRIWAVLLYLNCVDSTPHTDLPMCSYDTGSSAGLWFTDRTWLGSRASRSGDFFRSLLDLMRLSCATRYADDLRTSSGPVLRTSPDDVVPALSTALGYCLVRPAPQTRPQPQRNSFISPHVVIPSACFDQATNEANFLNSVLSDFMHPRALPVLRRASHRARAAPLLTAFRDKHPSISRLLGLSARNYQFLDPPEGQIWAIKNFCGKSLDQQFRVASAVAADPNADPVLRCVACRVLACSFPDSGRDLVLAGFPTLARGARLNLLRNYGPLFGDDSRLAETAVLDKDPSVSMGGLYHLFRLQRTDVARANFVSAALSARTGNYYRVWARDLPHDPVFAALPYKDLIGLLARVGFSRYVVESFLGISSRDAILLFRDVVRGSTDDGTPVSTGGPVHVEGGLDAALSRYGPEILDDLLASIAHDPSLGQRYAVREAVGAIGDLRAIPALQPIKNDVHPEWYNRAVLSIRLKSAPDPFTFLLDPPNADPLFYDRIVNCLASRYTTDQLTAFLADDRAAHIRPLVCVALFKRRMADAAIPLPFAPIP